MAKLFFASDLHGDLSATEAILAAFEREEADTLILCGDLLYHGPRNDLPGTYAPKEVIERLSRYRDRILAVRGNCDTEVDQMVLPFPILSDYAWILSDGCRIFVTHGHRYDRTNPPPLAKGDILVHGHTHVSGMWEFGEGNLAINPGSPSIPKEGTPRGYLICENRTFTLKDTDGKPYLSRDGRMQ